MIGFLVFMVFMSFILALWEIQIEGKDGWAAKSPGWRIEQGWFVKLTGGRPITGYHVFMTLFLIAIVHLAGIFCRMELAIRKSSAWILCRYGFSGRLPVVCFESILRH